MTSHQYNALLKYQPVGQATINFPLWIMSYQQPQTLSGTNAQSKLYQHFYPSNYAIGPMTVTGNTLNQDQYNQLAEFIRGHHECMMNPKRTPSYPVPFMFMHIKNEGLYVKGFIQNFQAGAQRFNPAPPYTFEFQVIRDANDKTSNIASTAIRSGWTGNFVDEGNKINYGSINPAPPSAVISISPGRLSQATGSTDNSTLPNISSSIATAGSQLLKAVAGLVS